jgi:lipoate-protein ligase B
MLCTVFKLGRVGYSEAYCLQRELLQERVGGRITDTLLLLEHPPTITIGKSGKLENILVSRAQLAERGIPVFLMDRGGDVTYHGPGQLVGYPIIDLRDRGRDLHRYVRDLEAVVIRTLADFGVKGGRDRTHPGVWVGDEEIAAVGLRVKRWVTMHGFALNVNVDLEPFSLIKPCGLSDGKATSISNILSRDVLLAEVTERLLAHFSEVFGAHIKYGFASTVQEVLTKNGSSSTVQEAFTKKGLDTLVRA